MTQAQNDKSGLQWDNTIWPGLFNPAPGVPKIWTTFWITLFFGIFGLIPAIIHSNRARALGAPVANYWYTFGGAYAVSLLIGFMILSSYGTSDGFFPW